MDKAEQAINTFRKGFNCSQAVFSTFSEEFGLNKSDALKLSCGFGAGMRQGEVCGAVTGAIMILGLKYGQISEEDIQAKKKTYYEVQNFCEKFKEAKGSIICRELLGIDISNEDNRIIARDTGLFNNMCPKFIEAAVQLLQKQLLIS